MKRNSKTQDFKNPIFDFRDLTCLGLQLYIMLLGIVVKELLKICSSLTSTPIKVEQSTTDLFILVNRIQYILFWITYPTKYLGALSKREKCMKKKCNFGSKEILTIQTIWCAKCRFSLRLQICWCSMWFLF